MVSKRWSKSHGRELARRGIRACCVLDTSWEVGFSSGCTLYIQYITLYTVADGSEICPHLQLPLSRQAGASRGQRRRHHRRQRRKRHGGPAKLRRHGLGSGRAADGGSHECQAASLQLSGPLQVARQARRRCRVLEKGGVGVVRGGEPAPGRLVHQAGVAVPAADGAGKEPAHESFEARLTCT